MTTKTPWIGDTRKPPLGIIPTRLHNEQRAHALEAAIARYEAAGFTPLPEWRTELAALRACSTPQVRAPWPPPCSICHSYGCRGHAAPRRDTSRGDHRGTSSSSEPLLTVQQRDRMLRLVARTHRELLRSIQLDSGASMGTVLAAQVLMVRLEDAIRSSTGDDQVAAPASEWSRAMRWRDGWLWMHPDGRFVSGRVAPDVAPGRPETGPGVSPVHTASEWRSDRNPVCGLRGCPVAHELTPTIGEARSDHERASVVFGDTNQEPRRRRWFGGRR